MHSPFLRYIAPPHVPLSFYGHRHRRIMSGCLRQGPKRSIHQAPPLHGNEGLSAVCILWLALNSPGGSLRRQPRKLHAARAPRLRRLQTRLRGAFDRCAQIQIHHNITTVPFATSEGKRRYSVCNGTPFIEVTAPSHSRTSGAITAIPLILKRTKHQIFLRRPWFDARLQMTPAPAPSLVGRRIHLQRTPRPPSVALGRCGIGKNESQGH